jgi:hypothetical protein
MSPIKSFFAFVFCCILSSFAQAQTNPVDTGKIELVQDYKVRELLEKHVELNSKSYLKGYRIKIHFGSDKTKAREIKSKFISKFPDVPAYERYDVPNFNIRVGDFRTKLEAYRFLKEVKNDFPSAFIVQDEIELPKIE